MVLGDSCPDAGAANPEIAAQEAAVIPLKEGLTLSSVWVGSGRQSSGEHECLTQVAYVGTDSVNVSNSCTWPGRADASDRKHTRMVCRRDLRDASMYHTAFHDYFPAVIGGSTTFSLSTRSFGEIKGAGETRHRYVQLAATADPALTRDLEGVVKRESNLPFTVIVNEREVALPAIQLSGQTGDLVTRITVLDDARFPLVLDYGTPENAFSNRISKISFPTSNVIEGRLATEKRATVYGIYFSTASDVLRAESDAVLREVADALSKNADWNLDIEGHTDNIGGDAMNMDLSSRRSAAVKKALVERYSITAARLTTSGFGASRPKETNDTIEGRARNRRVELVRK